MDDKAWCAVRPSGTEPKIKFYIGVRENSMEEAEKSIEELSNVIKELGK